MAITQKNDYYYGDNVADLNILLGEYSKQNGHPAEHLAQSVCICGGKKFVLSTDERKGVAMRRCTTCNEEHIIMDDEHMASTAQLQEHACLCEKQAFFLVSAIATDEHNTACWYYQGAMCPSCGLIGVYADWQRKGDTATLLRNV